MQKENMTQNQKQIAYWNGEVGNKWDEYHHEIDEMLEEFSIVLLDEIGNCHNKSILDIGCGAGTISYSLAKNGAKVFGADVSKSLLANAQSKQENKINPRFELCDVTDYQFIPDYFDLAVSRFGVMFFDDSVTSFKNIHNSMKPNAKLIFIAWQSPQENEWIMVTKNALHGIAEAISANNPDAPGAFAFNNPDRVRAILTDAGFRNIEITGHERNLYYNKGKGLAAGVSLLAKIGPASRNLAALPLEQQKIGITRLTQACKDYVKDESLCFKGKVWLVSAEK
ncbi:class I SAM-dependent methyltransferase [Pseudaquidulcibacter saccharophilus]|uniref:class I SAM-dependent methyltransferase n=1 Tax=Pseudaquidulcibacter saccharophilus TaxID=2831900 RepID=UPI001EFF54FB|nr:class I SAM-dependent methyltransferase [Pseudaquidulcibacter saccharophilus]